MGIDGQIYHCYRAGPSLRDPSFQWNKCCSIMLAENIHWLLRSHWHYANDCDVNIFCLIALDRCIINLWCLCITTRFHFPQSAASATSDSSHSYKTNPKTFLYMISHQHLVMSVNNEMAHYIHSSLWKQESYLKKIERIREEIKDIDYWLDQTRPGEGGGSIRDPENEEWDTCS